MSGSLRRKLSACFVMSERASTIAVALLAATSIVATTTPVGAAVIITEVAAHDRQLNQTVNGGANVGDESLIRVGRDPGGVEAMFSILRWTLTSVPPGELADSDGTVTLHVASEGGTFTGQTIEAYAIVPANAGWNESTPGNYASWDYRNTPDSVTPGTPWVGGSGLGAFTPGLGYGLTALDGVTWTGANTPITLTIPHALIDGWLANPGSNAGIVLRQQTAVLTAGFLRIHSSEAGGGLEPTLAFAIPEPSSLWLVGVGSFALLRRRAARI